MESRRWDLPQGFSWCLLCHGASGAALLNSPTFPCTWHKRTGRTLPHSIFFLYFCFSVGDTEIMGRVNSKSSSGRQRQKSAQTLRGLNLPCVTTVILLSCHHLQINYSLTSVTAMSRRRCFKIFVADQLLDSPSPSPWFIIDAL